MIEKLLKKHAKNFVTAERHEGKLEGIHYHENGSIYVTNSHTVLAFHQVHVDDEKTIHYKSGKEMNIEYPDVGRILEQDYSESFNVNIKEIIKHIGIIEVAANVDTVAAVEIKHDGINIKIENHEKESFKLILTDDTGLHNAINVDMSVIYFVNMLKFFKDAAVDEIVFSHSGKFRPLSFRSSSYEIIILPVRRYS